MPNIILSSVGAILVSAVALSMAIFLCVLSLTVQKEPWNKWGCALSFIVFLYGIAVFFQFYLGETTANRICDQIQISGFVLLTHACYYFTLTYLGLHPPLYFKRLICFFHAFLLLMIWWPGLIVEHSFIYKKFFWLSKPYIESPISLLGQLILIYLGMFGVYIVKLWVNHKRAAGVEDCFFAFGIGIWVIFCFHDLACAFGFESVQYLSIYGFFGFIAALFGATIKKYLNMYKDIESSKRAMEFAKNSLEQKVKERTRDLLKGNEQLKAAVESRMKSERRIAVLSEQTEQFSRAVAAILLIENEQQFFDTVCNAIVKYSDYNRVLISLFKESQPYRDIIGYGGVDSHVIDRLRKVEMPARQYDQVFEKGIKKGRQSFYIPHTMKEILKQEATIYGKVPVPKEDGMWHPEDNLFVKMVNEKNEFIGVISVDDSRSGTKPTDETVRPLEIFSSLISQIIMFKKEQKKALKLEEQLMQARKMESLGTLTGGIAHDFNNILGVIIGNTELALKELSKSNELYTTLESINYAGSKAADIVKQLLSFGKNADGNLKPVLMDDILSDLQKLIKSTIPSTVEVKTRFKTGKSVIMADPVQINQIFLNLCLNAAQSMENQEGTLTISCDFINLSEDKLSQFPGLKQEDHLRIRIADNGQGIDPKIIDKIFDPYFTTKDVGKGSGVGLAVVHGIVQHHHGAITVKSRLGKGTLFELFFPIVEKEPEPVLDEKDIIETGRLEMVLLVDDEPLILEMMSKILKWLGYKVTTVQDSQKALEIFKTTPQKFDLVITDMTMPGMSGIGLIKKIVEIKPEQPIIICTGYNESIYGKTAENLSIAALIMKPVRINILAREVKMALSGKQD